MPPRYSSVAVVILAAGLGSRLNAVINDKPKWMVPVGEDFTVADHQLAAVEVAVHPDAPHLVVTGAHHKAVEKLAATWAEAGNTPFACHFNPHFAEWNNWYSVLTALEYLATLDWNGPVMVMNGDMFCPPEWILSFAANLQHFETPITLAIDPHHPLTEEAMKVGVTNNVIDEIGKVGVKEPVGEYIGLTGLTHEGAGALMEHLRAIRAAERYDVWYENGMQDAIAAGVAIGMWTTPEAEWVEIDDEADLAKARTIAAVAV